MVEYLISPTMFLCFYGFCSNCCLLQLQNMQDDLSIEEWKLVAKLKTVFKIQWRCITRVAFQDQRGLHQVCFIQSCKGSSWRKGFKSIIWVTLKINGVENVFRCVARKPFCPDSSLELVWFLWNHVVCVIFCSWYKKEVVQAGSWGNVIGEWYL